jgi:hypothetical protein
VPSNEDLNAEQLRAVAAKAIAFREYCDALRKRGAALRWRQDDQLILLLDGAWERASWLAVHCASRAGELERGEDGT